MCIRDRLYARQAGKAGGQHIRVSLMETAIALLGYHVPVSYTHLTLPTSDLEEISGVAVSLKKNMMDEHNCARLL